MTDRAEPESLAAMRARGGTWAAYENQALDSANAGHLQFLRVGEGCTFAAPPPAYPHDSAHGLGWRYRFVGYVNPVDGSIEPVVAP